MDGCVFRENSDPRRRPVASSDRRWRGTSARRSIVVRRIALAATLVASLAASPAMATSAADESVVSVGASDADSIAIYSGLFNQSGGPGTPFWWNHTDLTVAVVAAPNVDPSLLQAIHDGIATWRTVLSSR